jgi:glycosyltransferase involved in cell wall biosynthesis
VRRAVESVVAQDYEGDLECIVVHDQEAPQESLLALARPGREVSVMVNDHAAGLAGGRNAGRERAKGELIAACDDDDLWHPEKLRLQVAWLAEHPEIDVVGAGIRLLMPDGEIASWPGRSETVTKQDLLRNRIKELHSSTLLCRREAFDRVGGFDENLPFGYGEDYDWLLRAAVDRPLGVVTQPLADINKIGQSWFRERQAIVAEGLEFLLAKHPDFSTSRRGGARVRGQIAFAHASAGNRKDALQWAGRALGRWPADPHALLALANVTVGLDPEVVLQKARSRGKGVS